LASAEGEAGDGRARSGGLEVDVSDAGEGVPTTGEGLAESSGAVAGAAEDGEDEGEAAGIRGEGDDTALPKLRNLPAGGEVEFKAVGVAVGGGFERRESEEEKSEGPHARE
jgi:hypothetical protein